MSHGGALPFHRLRGYQTRFVALAGGTFTSLIHLYGDQSRHT
jgi:hypothetical protein